MIRLSIITINYNNKTGLEKTIQSILSQSFTNYEWIIIDGGSVDGSNYILEQNKEKFSYFISEPDKGIYNAMNKGIAQAKGQYCFFLNSGDFLVDNKVFDRIFENNPTEDILFGNLYVTLNNKVVNKAYGKVQLTFSDVYAHTIKHQASFIKRSLFENFGNFNENRKIVADWEFFIKTLGLKNVTYQYINTFVSYFDNDGLSNHNIEIIKKEREQVIRENIPLMMQPDYEFLNRYRKYEKLYNNNFIFFFIRLINKFL